MLDWFFGRTRSAENTVWLDRARAWELTGPADPDRVMAALELILPSGSVIALETTGIDPEVERVLRPYVVPPGLQIRAGILWPRPTMLHVRVTPESLQALHDLWTTLPAPQICEHVYAYAGNDLLLEWTDALFADPIYLSERLPEAAVARFRDALGVTISQRPDAV